MVTSPYDIFAIPKLFYNIWMYFRLIGGYEALKLFATNLLFVTDNITDFEFVGILVRH